MNLQWRKQGNRITLSALFLGLSACTTILTSSPVKDEDDTNGRQSGVRYSLPAVHFLLKPQADGTVKLEEHWLPDPTRMYTLSLTNVLSNAVLDVQMENGMLKTVSLDGNSTAVAEKAITTATGIRGEQQAKREEDAKTQKTKDTDEETKLKTARQAITDQENKVELAKAKRNFYEKKGAAYQEQFDTADLEYELANTTLTQMRKSTASDGSTFNRADLQKVHGPVLFRMLPDQTDVVRLVAMEQKQFDTSTSALSQVTLTPQNVVPIVNAAGKWEFTVEANVAIEFLVNEMTLTRVADGTGSAPVIAKGKLAAVAAGQKLTVTLDKALVPPGKYYLNLVYVGPAKQRASDYVTVDVK